MEDSDQLGTIVNNMPELPEVETVTRILKPNVVGLTIKEVKVYRPKTIIGDADKFISSLKGETFLDITRIGKFIIFHLSNDKVIISHLRMEGKYYKYKEAEPDSNYARVVFIFTNGEKLCYDDSRCFGIMILSNENDYKKQKEIAKLGPEPFDIKDVTPLLKACKNKNLPIKTALLDQTLMTGLGNIYVDETLFKSNIHPLTPAKNIKKDELEKIVKNAQDILLEAIKLGGSTIKSYHPGKDIDGMFQNNIQVYGKKDESCPKCGATLRFIKVNGRGTTFCPNCQKKVGAPLNVGITGKIASGKSTFLKEAKKAGCEIISSDEIVNNLYQKQEVARLIEKTLKIKFKGNLVDKNQLREIVSLDEKNKKKLEKIIHPLVRKEIEKILKVSKAKIRIVEVPLLFESGFDNMFDTIIVIDINKDKQMELLNSRDKQKALLLSNINKSNKIDANIAKATYVISNNSSKEEFINECQEVIDKLKHSLN